MILARLIQGRQGWGSASEENKSRMAATCRLGIERGRMLIRAPRGP